MKSNDRIGILGGSFDPPHLGHLILAEFARAEARLSKVLFIPACQSPHKLHGPSASASHRVAMTRRAIKGNRAFAVSDLEVRRGGISYTADTIETLAGIYPDAELFLLLGSDSFADFHAWKSPDLIIAKATLLVYPRPGTGGMKDLEYGRHAQFITAPQIEISSSMIRRRVASGRPVRYLVPEVVEQYILANGLYSRDG